MTDVTSGLELKFCHFQQSDEIIFRQINETFDEFYQQTLFIAIGFKNENIHISLHG